MGVIDKIENYIMNKIRSSNNAYGLILCELEEYSKYVVEVEEIRKQGHEHYKVKETEEKILRNL